MSDLPSFATVDPFNGMTETNPGQVLNLCAGQWKSSEKTRDDIPDPMNGDSFLQIPDTRDLSLFLDGIRSCPKTGLHNPFKEPQRYVSLGRTCAKAAAALDDPIVVEFFVKLMQRVMPKSHQQCLGEVVVTRIFLENFAGDGVRFLARGFSNPGDHTGQESRGYRWPYGPVAVIAPFNFPLEIPALQVLGALFMGNRPLVKIDSKVSVVFEQFVRLLIECGMSPLDMDLIHCPGHVMGELLETAKDDLRMVQFTGSSQVAEIIARQMNGRVRLEDAGFDWKILGPDYDENWLDYVAWQCDQDAYNASGQKCSAQSILFMHKNWSQSLLPKLTALAERRSLSDLTLGPVLTWTNTKIAAHIQALTDIGGEVLFGGKPLQDHNIPNCYGAYEATAVGLPLTALKEEHFDLATKELFGPFQVIVEYDDDDIPAVLEQLEKMSHHLTAAVVSGDIGFQNRVLGATVNGTTYCGMRARTTGAPQNHWFGPSGDPRGAGIGTPEAIQITWSAHREIIMDQGPKPEGWEVPESA